MCIDLGRCAETTIWKVINGTKVARKLTYIERTANINPGLHEFVARYLIALAVSVQVMAQIPIGPCTKCSVRAIVCIVRRGEYQIAFDNVLAQPGNKLSVDIRKWFLLVNERLCQARRFDAIFTELGKLLRPHMTMENRFDDAASRVQQKRRKFWPMQR